MTDAFWFAGGVSPASGLAELILERAGRCRLEIDPASAVK
jgi:hypothetical protein